MMALLLAALEPRTIIEAERAFAADAQRLGSAAASRKWAADDATVFVPAPVLAKVWLADREHSLRSLSWSPITSYLACDGELAANTSEWHGTDGSFGYFTTVWGEQADGSWRWLLWHGDTLSRPRPRSAEPVVRQASCVGDPDSRRVPFDSYRVSGLLGGGVVVGNATVRYAWHVEGDLRVVQVAVWTGERWDRVVDDHVTLAPPPPAS